MFQIPSGDFSMELFSSYRQKHVLENGLNVENERGGKGKTINIGLKESVKEKRN